MPENPFKSRLVIILAVILLVITFLNAISNAAEDGARWSPLPLPSDGDTGNWTLAGDAEPALLTVTADGTLYCYATPTGTTDTLFQSKDSGLSWRSIGRVKDTIIAIAVVPQDATTIYYATVSTVYRSTDGGNTFMALACRSGWRRNRQRRDYFNFSGQPKWWQPGPGWY